MSKLFVHKTLIFRLFFLSLLFIVPWTFQFNETDSKVGFITEESVGFYQTNTCEFSLYQTVQENIINRNIDILPDRNSSVNCFGKINGVDLQTNKLKVYIGTNLNVDFLLQSLFFLFCLSLIPKSNDYRFKYPPYFSIFIVSMLIYVHLVGEQLHYEYFTKVFDLELKYNNFFLLSIFSTVFLTLYIFKDLVEKRLHNLINFIPFMFLFIGAFNSLNLNFYMLILSFIGINAILENKYSKKFTFIFIIFSLLQVYNLDSRNTLFDVDKLKGFINSSQNTYSQLFWTIIYFLTIVGVIYIIENSKNSLNLKLLRKNFLFVGTTITVIGVVSAVNPFVNFISYYYLGLNKAGIKTLDGVAGNTWRGLGPSAEALGEFYAFTILLSLLVTFFKKITLSKIELFLLFVNLYGLYKANNIAALISLVFILFLYSFLQVNYNTKKKIFVFLIISSILLFNFFPINYSYTFSSKALLKEAYNASEIGVNLPGDQNSDDAIDNLNFGEILSYSKDTLNISNSLYYFTNIYTNTKDIKYLPNTVGLISAISLPINRSEKWGVFLAKYNPDKINLNFGYGPQQITEYYLGHQTKVNTGLVLPHSSLLDYLIFYGVFGVLLILIMLIRNLWINKDNYLYVSLLIFLLLNFVKSDSLLYVSSFVLFLFISNLYKFAID